MDLLAYWRIDNYRRDLDEGAGFHFNSKQPRLHSAINTGQTLWLFTRIVGGSGLSEYRILAKLIVCAKTINPPSYKYGPFRVWADLSLSEYYRATVDPKHDAYELLRLIPLASGSFRECDRTSLARAAQSIRALHPKASILLQAFCQQIPIETRAHAVLDERQLETAYQSTQAELKLLLKDEALAYSPERRAGLLSSYPRNRQLVADVNQLYCGRCQLCGFDSPTIYGVEAAQAHHIIYRSRGGPDSLENLVLACPNHHTVIHQTEAKFDYARLHFIFPNGRVEPLCINEHLTPASAT
ncbi:MAG: HNH endonuclease [Planctomycetota bacterium]|nr:HNH endonuclease [Planctomycetota bacterium]